MDKSETYIKTHGKIATKGNYKGCRWCSFHNHYHGALFPCEHYDEETLVKISKLDAETKKNWSSPDFIQKQLDEGMRPEEVIIMQMFAGLRG